MGEVQRERQICGSSEQLVESRRAWRLILFAEKEGVDAKDMV